MSPAIEHAITEIAEKHRKLADLYDLVAKEMKGEGKSIADCLTIPADQVDACKSSEVAAKDKAARRAKAEKPAEKPAEPPKPEKPAAPAPTPEQIATDLKTKLVALCNTDRAKAIAILATAGAKKFSDLPADKHVEVLTQLTAALDAARNTDPLA